MKQLKLTGPEMMFVIGTRAALAAGVALLLSERLRRNLRRRVGWTLLGVGAATTLPAALMVLRKRHGGDGWTMELPPRAETARPLAATA